MSEPNSQPLVAVAVYGTRAAAALDEVTSVLDGAGVTPGRILKLLAIIQAGAVESAQGDVLELAAQPPAGSTAESALGWSGAVQAAAAELAHVADRTVNQARIAAASLPARALPTASVACAPAEPVRTRQGTVVDHVPEDFVREVMAAAERIFVDLTGNTDYRRAWDPEELLAVVLQTVYAEDQEGYVARLEAYADRNRRRLATLYGAYGPGKPLAELDVTDLAGEPGSVVICERLDTVPLWLEGVWVDDLDDTTFERFRDLWRYGCDGTAKQLVEGNR
ncbi:hypothetical protein [Streptomyces sp. NPDC004230]